MVLALGLSWPINKVGLGYTSASNYMELRFIIGTLAMFLIAWANKNLKLPSKKDLPLIFTIGIFQMAVMMSLANYGLSLVGAGKATFLVFTVSVWIIPISAFLNRKISFLEGLSFLIGLLGICCLIELWHIEDNNLWKGYLILLLSALSYTVGVLCGRHMHWHRPIVQLLPWQLLLATACTIAIAQFQGTPFLPLTTDFIFVSSLLYTGVISSAIGFWLVNLVAKHLHPATTSLGLLFVPIIAFCTSALFLHEQISLSVISGVSLLTLGSLIHIYSGRKNDQILP
ncbi:MAG: DMT family transporter, partial [Chlamydiales bacterium]|nr:DMT family transporter [Chlamydiales bacterium]